MLEQKILEIKNSYNIKLEEIYLDILERLVGFSYDEVEREIVKDVLAREKEKGDKFDIREKEANYIKSRTKEEFMDRSKRYLDEKGYNITYDDILEDGKVVTVFSITKKLKEIRYENIFNYDIDIKRVSERVVNNEESIDSKELDDKFSDNEEKKRNKLSNKSNIKVDNRGIKKAKK